MAHDVMPAVVLAVDAYYCNVYFLFWRFALLCFLAREGIYLSLQGSCLRILARCRFRIPTPHQSMVGSNFGNHVLTQCTPVDT